MSVATTSRQILSTVHRGTAFEIRTLGLLQNNLSMSLTSVAGRGDGGVDLLGWWWLPHDDDCSSGAAGSSSSSSSSMKAKMEVPSFETRRKVRVLVQCKAEAKRMGPRYVRELEGVAARYVYDQLHRPPPSSPLFANDPDTTEQASPIPIVAVLVSASSFTKASILCALSSPIPFLLMHLPEKMKPDAFNREEQLIGSAILNPALSGIRPIKQVESRDHGDPNVDQSPGLGGSRLELRWERPSSHLLKSSNTLRGSHSHLQEPPRLGLWWGGRRVPNWVPESRYS
ncbi:hypothetical protein FRB96_006837 [Tulasnella sp. 330]|nr:hypothetical protein FRB96_006837 [Tulasnella sp. 330]KAG8872692.1 hypothetical protein FRB97_007423 [Tulasnella sp. 331]KAG8874960.1 hypothetical protein FRB98_008144 [Tulasnella sp. 332]